MADIKPAEISAIIKKQLTGSDVSPLLDEVGTVSSMEFLEFMAF